VGYARPKQYVKWVGLPNLCRMAGWDHVNTAGSSIMIPTLPDPDETGPARLLARFYSEEGVVVCRGDGSGAIRFPYAQFKPHPSNDSVAVVVWDTSVIPDAEKGGGETPPFQYLGLTKPGSSDVEQLTPLSQIVGFEWSPDGSVIWYATGGSQPREVWRVNLPSRKVERWRTGTSPRPSQDGHWLAFLDFHPYRLCLQEIETGSVDCIGEGMPFAWSPNSRYLAYVRTVREAWQVFVYDSKDRKHIHVAPKSPFSYWPSWLPGSHELVFERCARGRAGPPSQICKAPLDSERETRISDGPWDEQPQADPESGAILFQRRDPVIKSLTVVYLVDPEFNGGTIALGPGQEPAFLRKHGANDKKRP
jgi:hypothetical protein